MAAKTPVIATAMTTTSQQMAWMAILVEALQYIKVSLTAAFGSIYLQC